MLGAPCGDRDWQQGWDHGNGDQGQGGGRGGKAPRDDKGKARGGKALPRLRSQTQVVADELRRWLDGDGHRSFTAPLLGSGPQADDVDENPLERNPGSRTATGPTCFANRPPAVCEHDRPLDAMSGPSRILKPTEPWMRIQVHPGF